MNNEIAKTSEQNRMQPFKVLCLAAKKAVIYYYYSGFNIDGGIVTSVHPVLVSLNLPPYDYTGDTDGYITINVGAGAANIHY